MTVAGGTAYLVQRDRVLHAIDDHLHAAVESARVVVTGSGGAESDRAAAAPETAGFTDARTALEAVLARVLPGPRQSAIGILDGAPTYVSALDTDFHLEDDPAFLDRVVAETADGSVRLGTAQSSVGNLRYIAIPIIVQGSDSRGLFVTAYDVDAELAVITTAFTTYAWVALTSLVGIGLVGWYVAGRLLRPIRHLTAAASHITATDLSERIPVAGNDDVSALTATVNDMLGRLDTSITTQQQLLTDVRHELKTPLTIVRGHLELVDATDADDVRATRALVIDELDRMSGLVDEIGLLADSQTSGALQRREVDVADLSEQVFSKASAISNHDWRLAETATVVASVDAGRITQAWLQLADNAAKYSPAGSLIQMGSRLRTANRVEFWVLDEGPGIPEGMEERIFERFGRVDARRGIQGSGLGLAIVAAIAQAHGGTVTLQTSPGGSRFAIDVPTAQDGTPR
ncbi:MULTISPECIES: ATP-binding protein [unclassified Salinibacterium]|uniref:sensor histidine kinase n=1 Tax=unclassified Salinibacterium TaxID=2632331 RepID=UPI00141D84E1|nr:MULTISPECIES: ATP-binding protein [unclassified Salinibacterium]